MVVARRDGGRQGETAVCKERRRQARRDGSRQGETTGGSSGARRDGRGGACKCATNQLVIVQPVPSASLDEDALQSLPSRAAKIGRASCRERVFNWV